MCRSPRPISGPPHAPTWRPPRAAGAPSRTTPRHCARCSHPRPTSPEADVEILARTMQATRRYGPVTALDGVRLDVPAGQLLGLLGPNGAGKTSLLQLLAGLRQPTSGTVELFGGDPRVAARRRRLGCTPQETGLPSTLRVHEIVEFVDPQRGRQ